MCMLSMYVHVEYVCACRVCMCMQLLLDKVYMTWPSQRVRLHVVPSIACSCTAVGINLGDVPDSQICYVI